jgi:replication-associated recombination protein RarA
MIPNTKNGLHAMACVSALQKCIRRSMEREAMAFAVELMHTSKAFHSMVCKRLQIISHEDIDTEAAPHIVPFDAIPFAAKSVGESFDQMTRGVICNNRRTAPDHVRSRESAEPDP